MKKWKAPDIWEDGECWIIGGGPTMPRQFDIPQDLVDDVIEGKASTSKYEKYLEPIKDEHVIGVNNAYKIADWIDIVFFGDWGWYKKHGGSVLNHPGLAVTCCTKFHNKNVSGLKFLDRFNSGATKGLTDKEGEVCWNHNSGGAAINLAAHLGVSKIYLLGFDMKLDNNDNSHWDRSSDPPFDKHLEGFPKIKRDADDMGIDIINVSPNSAIDVFPKKSLDEVL